MGAGNQTRPLQEQSELSTSKHRSVPHVIILLLLEMGSHCVSLAGLDLALQTMLVSNSHRDPPASALQVLGLRAYSTTPGHSTISFLVLFYLLRQGFPV